MKIMATRAEWQRVWDELFAEDQMKMTRAEWRRLWQVFCFEHYERRYTADWDTNLWIHALHRGCSMKTEGAEYCGYKDSGRKRWFIGIVPGEIK